MLRDCWREWGLRVDTALEHEIFVTIKIGHNDKYRKNDA